MKIDAIFTDCLELLLLAKYSDKNSKLLLINKTITKFDSLKFFLRIAWEVKALDNKNIFTSQNHWPKSGACSVGGGNSWQNKTPLKNPEENKKTCGGAPGSSRSSHYRASSSS